MANQLDLEEQEQLDQLKHFWSAWGTLISCVVLALAGAAAAWSGYQYWQSRQAGQASALFDATEVAIISGDKSRLEQSFADLISKYSNNFQTSQAALGVANFMHQSKADSEAKSALIWASENASDDGIKALAKLRLASVLMVEKNFSDALKIVSGDFPNEFNSLVSDRKGDIYLLQEKRVEAIKEYERAFKEFDINLDFKRIVEIKLNSLGAVPMQIDPSVISSSKEKE